MSEAWVTYGLGADEPVSLLHGGDDDESKGLLAQWRRMPLVPSMYGASPSSGT